MLKKFLWISCLLIACTILSTCGGGNGGGSSDYKAAAETVISVVPGSIDPGDRSLVSVRIWDVHPDGILLKVRFPLGLSYVKNSGQFEIHSVREIKNPIENVSDSENTYLVFFFSGSTFGDNGKDTGTLKFEIQATKASIEGEVEVDPVIRDLSVPADEQFDISNPLFGA
ncbi:MAG: hypothetical protein GYA55_02405, partial [SAR324 cluster bacterium]|nr:hypothetical protein [SAR324 cluster bacterium]